MPKVQASINIENVVASATLDQRVDLNAVVKGHPGVEYRPEQFPGLVFRLKKPKTATLIFNSGTSTSSLYLLSDSCPNKLYSPNNSP